MRDFHIYGLALLLLARLPTARAATPKQCDLLSHQAAQTIFGAPLAKTLPENNLMCAYYNNADTSAVNIHFLALPASMAQASLDQIMKSLPHKDYPTDVIDSVPGLGEQNFFITDKQIPRDTLTVLYHRTFITLIVSGSKNANLRPAMIDVMKRALSRF